MRSSQLHRNRPLENVSVAYQPQGFIGDQLSPKVSVVHESDLYYVYSKDNLTVPETLRADGAESNKASFNVSTSSYQLNEHALHDDITDRQRKNVDKAIAIEVDVTEALTGRIQLRREIDLQTLCQTKTNWGNNTSLTSTLAWSANTTTSNPITQLDSAASVILQNSGKKPNVLAVSDPQFRAMKEHTSILERIKYTSPDSVTPQMIARLVNVEKVLVAESTYNSADEGISPSMAFIWTDTAFLAYIEPAPGLRKVSALYTLWSNEFGTPYTVKKWREEKLDADRIEVQAMFQNKAIATDCAYVIVDTNQ